MEHTSGTHQTRPVDVVVIGAGLAGLTAASYAARSGASVTVLDARQSIGGRARTSDVDGFAFNEGPHALYRAGHGMAALRELGIRPTGGNPPIAAPRLSIDGTLRRVPPGRATAQIGRLIKRLDHDRQDAGWVDSSAEEWIAHRVSDPVGRSLAAALVRLTSYVGDLATFSADGAITQVRAGLRGVTYLDGGWQQLVDALERTAIAAGARVERGARVSAADVDGGRWQVTWTHPTEGEITTECRAVVISSGGPETAHRLTGGTVESLAAAAAGAVPVHAACLDLGLRRLPRPSTKFVLGIDRSTYASVHTPAANLGSRGDVLHVMAYEPPADTDVAALEAIADEIQPGWRDQVAARQVGLRRVVACDRPRPGLGMAGRPAAVVPDGDGLFVAGDWVGAHDQLGGAALASGRAAGTAAAAFVASPARTAVTAATP
ncbi:MAG: FAD-dependent oxidoreductase [Acidimicrobiales bacterium]